MSLTSILLILVLIALNGFFVSVEFAAVTSRRSRLDMQVSADQQGAARLVRAWMDQPAARDRLIAATQLGITIVSLALGAVGENTFSAWLDPYFHNAQLPASLAFFQSILPALPLAISLIVVTSFHVVLGEQVPKVAVLRAPEQFALTAAPIMDIFGRVFHWFISLLDWATRMVLRLMGLPPASPHDSIYSLEEAIRQIVSGPDVEGVIEKPEREMMSAVIDFGELVVRQVALPRTEIIAVEANQTLRQVVEVAAEHGLTKLPVYEDTLDQMIGIVHLRDLLGHLQNLVNGQDAENTVTARELAREVLFAPETISVNNLLHLFRARRTHIAIVLDEYGGTAGLVTLEDLLEEIVGDVRDPFEAGPPPIQIMADGSAVIEGMTLIDEINQHFGLHLEDPFYDTIAGFVLGKLGRIPAVGDSVEDAANGVRLTVENMDGLRVERINLAKIDPPEA